MYPFKSHDAWTASASLLIPFFFLLLLLLKRKPVFCVSETSPKTPVDPATVDLNMRPLKSFVWKLSSLREQKEKKKSKQLYHVSPHPLGDRLQERGWRIWAWQLRILQRRWQNLLFDSSHTYFPAFPPQNLCPEKQRAFTQNAFTTCYNRSVQTWH